MAQIIVAAQDNQKTERLVLSGSSAETLYTCPDDQTAKVLGVNAYNTGSTATVTVAVHDGTTAFNIEAKSLDQDASHYFDLHGHKLIEEEQIRVTGASGVHLVLDALESGRA